MGQDTAGMLSDNLLKPLPNGWELSLSNEIYTSCDGQVFEGRGIAPDVPEISDGRGAIRARAAGVADVSREPDAAAGTPTLQRHRHAV